MLSTYSNSVVPGNYIDIYAYVQDDNKNKIAKLLENVKVIAVRTSNGLNVFESSTESRTPYLVYFGLPYEQDMLLKKVHAINAWGAGLSNSASEEQENTSMTNITLYPIPTNVGFNSKSKKKYKVTISSEEMARIIDDRAEDITTPDDTISNETNVIEENNKKSTGE
jgi:hypothetical protein